MKSHMIPQGFVGNLNVNLSHPPKLFAGLIPQADTVHDYWLLELDCAAGKLTKFKTISAHCGKAYATASEAFHEGNAAWRPFEASRSSSVHTAPPSVDCE